MTQPAIATDVAQPIDQDGVERTFVFCDVVGFTEMTERLGDRGAHDVIRRYRSIVREVVHELHGEELELRGDGFLLAYDSPSAALACASAVRRQLAVDAAARRDAPVSVRIGLHTGHALRDGDGYFGRSLIVASRIADRAAAGEILVSEPCWKAVEGAVPPSASGWRELRLKGIRHVQRVLVAGGLDA